LERDLTAPAETGFSPVVYPGPDHSVISIFTLQDRRPDAPLFLWHHVSTRSANGDTLGAFSTSRTRTGFSFTYGEAGGGGIQSRLWGGRPQTLYSPGRGILTSTGQASEFQIFGIDGKREGIIRADIVRTPVTSEEGSAILETFRRRLRTARNERGRNFVQRQLDIMEIPEAKDYWSNVHIDEYGYIWAGEPIIMYLLPEEGRLFRVFSPEGEYLGTTLWEEHLWGRASRGHFLTIVRDPDSGESVPTVYRIRPAVRGLKYP
jgi:hypothetical protein